MAVRVYSREELRKAMREVPHEVNIIVSAIAERSEDVSKRELLHIYLNESEERRPEALRKFRKILEGMNG